MDIKLTKTEKDFLINCLNDEYVFLNLNILHDIAFLDLRRHQDSKEIVKDLNSKIKISKSIINKLKQRGK